MFEGIVEDVLFELALVTCLICFGVPLKEAAFETPDSLKSSFFGVIGRTPLGFVNFPACGNALIATKSAVPRSRCLFMFLFILWFKILTFKNTKIDIS